MKSVPTIRQFLVGVALALAGIGGQLLVRAEFSVVGAVILLGGVCLFVFAFWGNPISSLLLNLDVDGWQSPRDWIAAGSLAVAVCLAIAGLAVVDVHEPSATFWLIYVLSLAVIVAIPAGLALADGIRSSEFHSSTILWLLLILAIAAATRFIGLSTLPFGTWYDEAASGLEALRIINEPQYRPIFTDGVNATGHYLYLIVAAFEAFGVSTRSIRLISAVAGVVTVAAAYMAGREMFGRSLGLVLAFMMAISRWAINFSRLGMYNALTPMFELLAIAFLARALRKNHLEDYILAGVSLGLGFCVYPAFQLFAVAVAFFLAYIIATEWRPGSRFWMGMVALIFSTLVVVAPVAKFAYERPESYFSRVQNTSLFADKEPEDRFPALVENLRKHLLMFNVRGDPNGRHNLPGEPMLDPITSALMVFGIALCLSRLRQPFSALLLSWFIVALMGGVLSLDFEAPQSLRSIAAMPAVYMLAVVPLYVLNQEWSEEGGRYYPHAAAGMIVLLLLPSAFYNIDTYFRKQAQDFASWNAFSTPETLTAKYLNALSPDANAYVISLYDKHPTVRFLAQGIDPYRRLETTASMPIVDSSSKDIALILDAERKDLYEEALRVYPNALHEEVRPPFGGPVVLYYVEIPAEERLQVQGFTGSYVSGADADMTEVRRDSEIEFVWPIEAPLPLPFSAEWTGVLAAETYGPYQFGLEAPGEATLYINETPVVTTSDGEIGIVGGAVILPRGLHQLRVIAEGGEGVIRLLWRTPDRETEVVPAWAVFGHPVSNNGLLGKYFANGEWSGEATLEQIDNGFDMYFHIPVMARPYSVEWEGKIAIPEAGQYGFGLESNDESILYINGDEVASSSGSGAYGEGYIDLTSGLHDILIRYADRSDHAFLTAYWQPPSTLITGGRQVIPDSILFPPQGDYERVAIPKLADLRSETGQPLDTDNVAVAVPADSETVVTGLNNPSGIASAPGGIVVTQPEQGQVIVLDGSGAVVQILERPAPNFQEPFDVAVDDRGNLFILDSGAGIISQFDSDLHYVADLTIDPTHISRARGIGLDDDGGLWIANTPGGQLVRYDLETDTVRSVPVKQHMANYGDSQPVDVAVSDDGSIYVTDAGVHKLSRYNERGMRLWSIDIPVANTLHGSHLTIGPSGNPLVSVPEQGAVLEIDENGNELGRWMLRTNDGTIVKPVGLTSDNIGAVYVTDVEGGRVLRFHPEFTEKEADATPAEGQ